MKKNEKKCFEIQFFFLSYSFLAGPLALHFKDGL
jgi:hypothetical protein